MEHLELTNCVGVSEYGIDTLVKSVQTLNFMDLNGIPAITPLFLEELRG